MRHYTRGMERLKNVGRVIRAGTWPDSSLDQLRYWLKRPPAERVAAGRSLHIDNYFHIHGRPLPRMVKVVRPYKPEK